MTFLATPLRLKADDAVRYILALPKAKLTWRPVGVTWHNAGAPNLTQWANYPERIKEAWGRNYDFYCHVTQHWHSGPHGMGTPDGWAFILCDMLADGVHASCFNHDHYGFETVGDFSHGADDPLVGPGLAAMESTANLIAATCEWLGLDPDRAINFHRECVQDHHACPGNLVTDEWAKGLVKTRLAEIKGIAPAVVTSPHVIETKTVWSPPSAAHTVEWTTWVQTWLNAHGASPALTVDGDFGDASKNALAEILAKLS